MQLLHNSMPCTTARALTRNSRALINIYGFRCQSHGQILLIRQHASSKAPTPSRKPAPKPLPYQPTQTKAQLDARMYQKQQEQQEKEKQQQQQQQRKRNEKAPISDLVRERWFAMLGFGSALGCLGYFAASLTMYWRSDPAPCYPLGCEPETPTGRPSIQSPYEFDLHLDKSEWRYGITKLRREIGAEVRGHVLEVAIGTGRNMEFYPWDVITESLATPKERAKARAKARARSSSWIPGLGGKDRKGSDTSRQSNGAVLSFTGVDISPGMLDITLQRIRQIVPHMETQIPKKPSFAILAAKNGGSQNPQGHVVSFLADRIRLWQSDVQTALPAPPTLSPSPSSSPSPPDQKPSPSPSHTASQSPQKYDTILQTFGLCSVQDPVSLLSLMASSLQPNTGRILLLEHGRSIWDVVNGLLDRGARAHHERFGCWWNRDIEVIVHEAVRRVPGLEILRLERPGWATAGTHVVVELRVVDASAESEPELKERKPTGWASLLPSLLSTKSGDDPKKG
ncbi:hypothetical protein GGR51DRAFT_195851 [Nemania sp. FL0031]|nr:hypothetical protein GGR51DRAFT_195851 [Nemania sp. FL0031]